MTLPLVAVEREAWLRKVLRSAALTRYGGARSQWTCALGSANAHIQLLGCKSQSIDRLHSISVVWPSTAKCSCQGAQQLTLVGADMVWNIDGLERTIFVKRPAVPLRADSEIQAAMLQ